MRRTPVGLLVEERELVPSVHLPTTQRIPHRDGFIHRPNRDDHVDT